MSNFQKSSGVKPWAQEIQTILEQRYQLAQSSSEVFHFSVGTLSQPKKSLSSTVDFIHEIQRQLIVKRKQLA
jgi:hypothetical protein